MKTIKFGDIVAAAERLTSACATITPSCEAALKRARREETASTASFALKTLLDNAETARKEQRPVCQDTGMAVFFVKLGQNVHIEGGLLTDAINEGVRIGYSKHGLRASVLDPISRVNSGDNTPAVIHIELCEGDKLELEFMPKGFGSENMSKLYMLKPSQGMDGIKQAVVSAVREAGSMPCPPIVVGVGIGGTAEKAMEIAKRQLLREVGLPSEDPILAETEREILLDVNALGIGAQGFGGKVTALAVHIGKYPTHISALPVAVNIQCNAVRYGREEL